ncbi:MAG: 3-ketoacyl-ACP reductase [Planctomycetota bacterium]|nr:3-ketoacyl-ACP reductase [Planctomycetota bacterium]
MHKTPVALITGGARGIGESISRLLAENGHTPVINYFRSQERAERLVEDLRAEGCDAVAIQGDVSKAADRRRLVSETIDRFGRIDLLVNNAGITSPGRNDLLDADEEGWDLVFDTNLKGPFFLAQAVAREMITLTQSSVLERATIINISSISAYAVSTNRADYCMAKAALQMMTWLFADRLADQRIWVYEICPGVIASDMTAPVKEKYDELIANGMSPIRRWGEGQDVAQAVVALAAHHFPFSTGERINVDGGFHIRRL